MSKYASSTSGDFDPPISQSTDPELDNILDEFVDLLEQGLNPSIDEFVSRRPEYEEPLRRLLSAALAISRLAESSIVGGADSAISPDASAELGTLGDFQLLREIGRGGMGVVYEAEQVSLGRRVALKILPFAGVLDSRQLQRFRNEARAAATLDHPHIVHVHAVGQDSGVHFYAMQLIEGQSLAEYLDELRSNVEPTLDAVHQFDAGAKILADNSTACGTRLSTTHPADSEVRFRQIVTWALAAAEALQHAHEMGVVHRDIKPSNLLVNSEGKLWVTDFGLAMTHADTGVTMTGDLLGTLRYMSPEQILGQRSVIDHRTDVYSLGVTLYELLALQPAFRAANTVELQRLIEQDDPPRTPLRARGVPAELELIVYKAIEKHAPARYETAQAFADDLKRFLSDQPVRATAPTWQRRASKWALRHKGLVRGLIVSACISLLVTIVATVFVFSARQQTAIERIARNADAEAAMAISKNLRDHEYVTRIQLADRGLRHGQIEDASLHLTHAGSHGGRGFEWSYLSRLSESSVRKVGEHRGSAYNAQLSPNGKWLASAGTDGVRIWDFATHELIQTLTAHVGDVNGCSFSPDGRWLVTTGDDGTARIWDTSNWSVIATLQHSGPAGGGGFSPDGRLLMTGERQESIGLQEKLPEEIERMWPPKRRTITSTGQSIGENIIRVWDTRSWTPHSVLRGHNGRLQAGDASDDGQLIATGDGQGVVNIWAMPEGKVKRTFSELGNSTVPTPTVAAIDFAHRHSWIATVGMTAGHIWDVHTGALVARLPGENGRVRSIAFSPDDNYVLTGGDREGPLAPVRIWSLKANSYYEHTGAIQVPTDTWSIRFVNSAEVVLCGANGAVYRWKTPYQTHHPRFQGRAGEICRATVSPDSRWLACTSPGLIVRPLGNFEQTIVLDQSHDSDRPVAFSANSKFLASLQSANIITIWDTATWKPVATFPPASSRIIGLKFQREDSKLICAQMADGGSLWWNFPSGTPLDGTHWDFDVATSPRTDRVVVDNPLGIWQAVENKVALWTRSLPRARVALLSPDESRVAMARYDGSIVTLDLRSGVTISECIGSSGRIEGLAFSPEGQTLASHIHSQQQITLWHVATGRELLTINSGFKVIRSLEFTSDGARLIVAGQDLSGFGAVVVLGGPTAQ